MRDVDIFRLKCESTFNIGLWLQYATILALQSSLDCVFKN